MEERYDDDLQRLGEEKRKVDKLISDYKINKIGELNEINVKINDFNSKIKEFEDKYPEVSLSSSYLELLEDDEDAPLFKRQETEVSIDLSEDDQEEIVQQENNSDEMIGNMKEKTEIKEVKKEAKPDPDNLTELIKSKILEAANSLKNSSNLDEVKKQFEVKSEFLKKENEKLKNTISNLQNALKDRNSQIEDLKAKVKEAKNNPSINEEEINKRIKEAVDKEINKGKSVSNALKLACSQIAKEHPEKTDVEWIIYYVKQGEK